MEANRDSGGSAEQVVVYAFRWFDRSTRTKTVPPFKATAATIERCSGDPLPLTAETVDASEIDAEGRWFRVATAWSALK